MDINHLKIFIIYNIFIQFINEHNLISNVLNKFIYISETNSLLSEILENKNNEYNIMELRYIDKYYAKSLYVKYHKNIEQKTFEYIKNNPTIFNGISFDDTITIVETNFVIDNYIINI